MEFFPSSFNIYQPRSGTVVLGDGGSGPINVDMTYVALNSTATITASGSTQSTASPVTASYNVVITAASGSGVVLPIPTATITIAIVNRSGSTINIYPGLSSQIETQGTNNPIQLSVGSSNILVYTGNFQWWVL